MNIFGKYGLKKTKTRTIIFDKFKEIKEPISAETLYDLISKDQSINLTTIYRNLNTLEELNIVEKIVRQDGIAYYSLKSNGHSHYMICDRCKIQIQLESCPIDINFFKQVNESGFEPTGHILEIHGLCEKCGLKN